MNSKGLKLDDWVHAFSHMTIYLACYSCGYDATIEAEVA